MGWQETNSCHQEKQMVFWWFGRKPIPVVKQNRWYFGGLAGAGATCVTHPLDLVKVQSQTERGSKVSMFQVIRNIVTARGVGGLYSGVSAGILRQLTYSSARFGFYDWGKSHLANDKGQIRTHQSVALSTLSGVFGGLIGNPTDLINVRMQNDFKLPAEQRRNYKHVFDGFWKVASRDGVAKLWTGTVMTCTRCALMSMGQLTFYDLAKTYLVHTRGLPDKMSTHLLASTVAGAAATTLTQPADVLKTRSQTAKPTEDRCLRALIMNTAKEGYTAFYKGYVAAFARLAPQTILTFIIMEQLRHRFGYEVQQKY